jgi:GNAT superfamily N-acetyltransferase
MTATDPSTASARLSIRPYAPDDWEAIARVHDAARMQELTASVGPEAFLDLAATAEDEGLFDGELWVAVADEDVVGFVAYDDAEVTWLYVHPDAQRRGIGRALLRRALRHAEDNHVTTVEVTVLEGAPARGLYESEGFTLTETRTGPLVGNETFTATGHIMHRTHSPGVAAQ